MEVLFKSTPILGLLHHFVAFMGHVFFKCSLGTLMVGDRSSWSCSLKIGLVAFLAAVTVRSSAATFFKIQFAF